MQASPSVWKISGSKFPKSFPLTPVSIQVATSCFGHPIGAKGIIGKIKETNLALLCSYLLYSGVHLFFTWLQSVVKKIVLIGRLYLIAAIGKIGKWIRK